MGKVTRRCCSSTSNQSHAADCEKRVQALPPDRQTLVLALRTLKYVVDGYKIDVKDGVVMAIDRKDWSRTEIGRLPAQITSLDGLIKLVEANKLSL